jgi:ferrous iron transport protein B
VKHGAADLRQRQNPQIPAAPTPRIALVGNPNAGKSALFNALTGARQRTGNYPGVTVERKAGLFRLPDDRPAELVDLPGSYSLAPISPDEAVTRDVVMGEHDIERQPDALVIVVDAANLEIHLRFALELIATGLPCVLALNMVDLAMRDGLVLDPGRLAAGLGVPVVETVAVRRRGLAELGAALVGVLDTQSAAKGSLSGAKRRETPVSSNAIALEASRIARLAIRSESPTRHWTRTIDNVVLHPVFGTLLLILTLFLMFQAVFTGAKIPQQWISDGVAALQSAVTRGMPPSLLRSLLTDGVIAGVGAVLVFIPQILILFFFILSLEASGYMVRAAFLMDRLMSGVGLSGRAFIPLLSSFACAVPGIMATRTIEDPKDRLTTMLIAPLMTCSARLPVYTVIIAAFIPPRTIGYGIGLQGVVLLGLYLCGIVGALIAALVLRRTVTKSVGTGFMMEMPRYQWPVLRDLALGLWQRVLIFLKRAGTLIATTSVVLWLLLSFPRAVPGQSQTDASLAGHMASGLAVVLKPIGFNREIALALIPAMAAREVAVSALATTYAVDAGNTRTALPATLAARWSLPTALAFLAWFVFAPQCMSTIAVIRRETNGWKWPLFMVAYLFGLAYIASGITYWAARAAGL